MPHAIAAIPAFVAQGVANLATLAVYGLGGGAAAQSIVGGVTYAAVMAGQTLAINAAIAYAFMPDLPGPNAVLSIKQSTAPRRSGFGTVRTGGVYVLYESYGRDSHDVLAIHDGLIDGIEDYYLNDDRVELDEEGYVQVLPDGRYGYQSCRFYSRDGQATETPYDHIEEDIPLWTPDHRGDGVASIALHCNQLKKSRTPKTFPNGLPVPSVVYRAQRTYDPRVHGIESQGDESSWVWTENPMVHLCHYLTSADRGMGLSFERRIRPGISTLLQAINDCDGAVPLAAGGTEPRYRCGGSYDHSSPPADVIRNILSSCDGWMAQRGDGSFVFQAGVYREPTFILGDQHVIAHSIRHGTEDEQAINEFVPTFTDEANDYNQVDAGAWQDEDDIAARGGRVRSMPLDLRYVPSRTQARRLSKRMMARQRSQKRGFIVSNLYGICGLGERFIRVRISEDPDLADTVFEVLNVEIDLVNCAVTFHVSGIDVEYLEAWNPFTDEGENNQPGESPGAPVLAAPTIDSVVVQYETLNNSNAAARLLVTVSAPMEPDAWTVRWRLQGSTAWETIYREDDEITAVEQVLTGFVPSDSIIEIEVFYEAIGDFSPWSATYTVSVGAIDALSYTADTTFLTADRGSVTADRTP